MLTSILYVTVIGQMFSISGSETMDTLHTLVLCLCVISIQSSKDGSPYGDMDIENWPYEERFLPRRDPGKVGDVVEEDMGNGTIQYVITRAINPPVFELPNFLTDEECDHIRDTASESGMEEASVVSDEDIVYERKKRHSKTCFLTSKYDKLLKGIRDRASILTGLSKKFIHDSEDFQVGYYGVSGHYNFHHDSSTTEEDEDLGNKICCHQYQGDYDPAICKLCRYITILMYLNDVEEGGETVFPLADRPDTSIPDKFEHFGLLCDKASVSVSPRKGTAVMWYNNFIDPQAGWLGLLDDMSLHGGCPVKRGVKWISNLWITAPHYNCLTEKSKYSEDP